MTTNELRPMETLCDGVHVIPALWSPEECAAMLAEIEAMDFEEAPIGRGKRMTHVRNNDRIIWDHPPLAEALWDQLSRYALPSFFGAEPIGLNERFRIYRYTKGQRFDWHGDGRFRRDNGEQSLFTFLLYLTEDFRGGETLFRGAKVTPQQGLACIFEHKKEHKGAEVIEGTKIVLRSDLMYPPLPFK